MINAVFHSKEACLRVLQAAERQRQSWWTPQCSEFLRRVECTPIVSTPPHKKTLILLEGMDGVGKSRVARTLVDRLGAEARMIATPDPAFADIRKIFRAQTEELSRAFHSAANYIAAWDAFHATDQRSFVVFDRWWCSTCAMALANSCTLTTFDEIGDSVFEWPSDLPRPDMAVLLYVDEHIRRERIRQRAPEDAEERRLSAMQEMREVTMRAYRRFGLFEDVYALTYATAVNKILQLMLEKGLHHHATPFTEKELAEITPC